MQHIPGSPRNLRLQVFRESQTTNPKGDHHLQTITEELLDKKPTEICQETPSETLCNLQALHSAQQNEDNILLKSHPRF